ncbi:hypothetical protein [Halolamina sp.]|uniref:DUF7527 domain-containing protein n=1 Tax=Halolamina sp. TaxID=1940283 RepID=UPI0035657777
MRNNTVERVTEWESEPFTDGYQGLRELADREFTGAATDGHAWLFMLNGRVLGGFDGSMEAFDGADGTAYTAPDPALPLLFAMQETGGETRAEYYSEETPISEASRTLESGTFTGYIELSDNVLSGDYYIAYYGGRSLPVAFVGNNSELLTAEEAFERADDEVGIYTVNTVDLDITDIPGSGAEPEPEPTPVETREEPVSTELTNTEAADPEPKESASTEPEPIETGSVDESGEEPDAVPEAEAEQRTAHEVEAAEQASEQESRQRDVSTEPDASATRTADTEPAAASETTTNQWHGAKTIPALDPEESVDMAEEVGGDIEAEPDAAVEHEQEPATPAQNRAAVDSEALEELRAERDRLQERVEELESENDRLEGEHERLERERDEAQSELSELEREVEKLHATVEQLESDLAAAEEDLEVAEQHLPEGDHEVSAESALKGTNLFVRYDRQSGPTLKDAHDGNADREAVNGNIRLEHHTEFDDDGAIVNGEPFEAWLHETMEFGFARWVVAEFVHDIRETRNQSALDKLYDTVPEIDRVEFRGEVELGQGAQEGEEAVAETVQFDVVIRNRMGNPLLVADLNDSREPATESMLARLIENATPVAKSTEGLASAFFVTASYYEPGALETAEEATGGGFLSRDKQKSFVKLSRKNGYHLCLVETRDGEFHVTVPEL